MKKIFKLTSLLGIVLLVAFTSCEKDSTTFNSPTEPVPSIQPIVLGNTIDFLWDKVDNAVSYTIEVSSDDFKTIYSSLNTLETYCTVENLLYNTKYKSRLCTNFSNNTKSAWVTMKEVTTGERVIPNVLASVSGSDIFGVDVTIRWNNTKYLITRIELISEEFPEFNKTITISEQEQQNGNVIAKKLKKKTNYVAIGYNDNMKEGEDFYNQVAFRTGLPLQPGTIVISTGDDLGETIKNADDGAEIFLAEGSVFQNSEKITLNKNVHIFSDSDTPASFTFGEAIEVVGSNDNKPVVSFENIAFIRTSALNAIPFSVLADAKVAKLSFENCTFSNPEWGIVDVASNSGVSVDSILFNNCIIEFLNPEQATKRTASMGTLPSTNGTGGIGGQGLVLMNNSNPTVKNIVFTNSTINKLRMPLVKAQNNKKKKKITIKNVTLYNLNLIVDEMIRGGDVASTDLEIRNCMFSYNKWNSNFRPFINCGVRAERVDCNNYRTEDFITSKDNGGSNKDASISYDANGFLSEVIFSAPGKAADNYAISTDLENHVLGATGDDVFVNTSKGDFSFINTEHAQLGIGDPRWLPAGVIPAQ